MYADRGKYGERVADGHSARGGRGRTARRAS
jgi:hypothetical protein